MLEMFKTLLSGYSNGSTSSTSVESDTGCDTRAGIRATLGPSVDSPACNKISSTDPSGLPSFLRAESARNQAGIYETGKLISQLNYDYRGLPTLYPGSLPEYSDGLANGVPCNSDCNLPVAVNSLPQERVENNYLGRISSSVETCNGTCVYH